MVSGEAITADPVVEDNPVEGDQEYEEALVAEIITLPPLQTAVGELAVTGRMG